MKSDHFAPKSIDDIVFPTDHAKQLIKDIVDNVLPFPMAGKNGILLYGTYGTGKTTLAKLIPQAMEATRTGKSGYAKFLSIKKGNNGSALIRDIDDMTRVNPFAWGENNYFILDEVEILQKDAMASLRSVMLEDNSVFILTTNDLSKVDKGVQNRCHRIEFNAAPPERWLPLFKRVAGEMGLQDFPSDDQLLPVIDVCKGSARDIVSAAMQFANKRMANLSSASASSATQPDAA